MKKIALPLGLIFCSSIFAQSNWKLVTYTENLEEVIYIDVDSIQRSGDSITFWEKINIKNRTTEGNLSYKVQLTINCRTRDYIFRWMQSFDDRDNKGKITLNFQPKGSWVPIAPESNNDHIRLFVCQNN